MLRQCKWQRTVDWIEPVPDWQVHAYTRLSVSVSSFSQIPARVSMSAVMQSPLPVTVRATTAVFNFMHVIINCVIINNKQLFARVKPFLRANEVTQIMRARSRSGVSDFEPAVIWFLESKLSVNYHTLLTLFVSWSEYAFNKYFGDEVSKISRHQDGIDARS